MNDPLTTTATFGHGDPIAPVILGVTSIWLFAIIGLGFAAIGRTLGLIDDAIFPVIVLMVMITTLMAPPLLKAAIGQQKKRQART